MVFDTEVLLFVMAVKSFALMKMLFEAAVKSFEEMEMLFAKGEMSFAGHEKKH
jgi:hypothetical protein